MIDLIQESIKGLKLNNAKKRSKHIEKLLDYYNGNDTVKFGNMYINLFFESLNNFSVQPNECN